MLIFFDVRWTQVRRGNAFQSWIARAFPNRSLEYYALISVLETGYKFTQMSTPDNNYLIFNNENILDMQVSYHSQILYWKCARPRDFWRLYIIAFIYTWKIEVINWVDIYHNSGKLASLRKLKCDVSSVSPSSERNKELWVVCGLFVEQRSYFIGWIVATRKAVKIKSKKLSFKSAPYDIRYQRTRFIQLTYSFCTLPRFRK